MAAGGLVSIREAGDGAARYEAKLRHIEERLTELPLIAAAVFEGLEKYHEETWGRGVVDVQETDIRWPDHGPLENTGTLKDSMTRTGASGAVREITPFGLVYGTKLIYGKFLQGGTRKMQPKPVLRTSRAVRAVVGRIVRNWVYHGERTL